MAPAVMMHGDIAEKAGIVDLEGVADHPARQRGGAEAARKGSAAPTVPVALDGPLRAVGGSTARLEGRGAPTGGDAPRGGR